MGFALPTNRNQSAIAGSKWTVIKRQHGHLPGFEAAAIHCSCRAYACFAGSKLHMAKNLVAQLPLLLLTHRSMCKDCRSGDKVIQQQPFYASGNVACIDPLAVEVAKRYGCQFVFAEPQWHWGQRQSFSCKRAKIDFLIHDLYENASSEQSNQAREEQAFSSPSGCVSLRLFAAGVAKSLRSAIDGSYIVVKGNHNMPLGRHPDIAQVIAAYLIRYSVPGNISVVCKQIQQRRALPRGIFNATIFADFFQCIRLPLLQVRFGSNRGGDNRQHSGERHKLHGAAPLSLPTRLAGVRASLQPVCGVAA